MKKKLLLVTVLSCFLANAQDPIFTPAMSITPYGIVDSPIGEEVDKIIDGDINTKFLDFELDDGMGFIVDLGGLSYTATSIEVTTANDFEVRDPMGFEVFGSNDNTTYTSIASGDIPCVSDRFFTRTFNFDNDEAYMFYRVNYVIACDPSGGTGFPSIQVAETQLYGTTLRINDNTLSNQFALYPNPSYGTFMMKYSGSEPLTKALLIDMNGRIIQKIDINGFNSEKQIQLNNVLSGIYFMQISINNNIVSRKIIIK